MAVELAAARLRSLGIEDVVARLDDQLGLLTGGVRDEPRHSGLRTTLDWSHGLLEDHDRVALRRLSVFAGGFTASACEAVVGLSSGDALDRLDSLVNRSLLDFDRLRSRYRMLEPVRQYAVEHLHAAGESEALHVEHLSWVVAYAEPTARQMFTDPRHATRMLDAESANIAAAIGMALNTGHDVEALRLVGALGYYWFLSQRNDAQVWAPRAVERIDRVPERVAVRALLGAGTALCDQIDDDRAAEWLAEAVARYRLVENDAGLANALFWLGRAFALRGDPEQAWPCFTEADELFTRAGNIFGTGWARGWLANLAFQSGDLETAEAMAKANLALAERHGERHVLGATLGDFAMFAAERGDLAEAVAFVDQSIAIYRELGDRWQVTVHLLRRATYRLEADPADAARDVLEAINLSALIGADDDFRLELRIAAALLETAGRRPEAATLAARAAGRLRFPYRVSDMAHLADDPALDAATTCGRRMGLVPAAALAREWLADAYPTSVPTPPGQTKRPG